MPDRARFVRKWIRWVVPLLGVIALQLATADTALARAGGGGGYHSSGGGGGGFHSSGGHGGGGGGELIFDLIYMLFAYPVIGVPVLIAVIAFFVYSAKQGNNSYQSSVIRRGSAVMRDSEKTDAISGIRAHDPNFDEDALCVRIGPAFMKIQTAWCAQDLSTVRPFISDGVYERFALQFEEQKAEGYHDHMEGINLDGIGVANISSEGFFDEVSIRITATARDWRESLTDRKRISGSSSPEQFTEIWTFLRHRTAKSAPGKIGLMEGQCPNCGAPIEMNQSANCTHCKALLRSGEYDWVLTEITQESEWQVSRRAALPGVAALRNRDPEFDTVSVEDRASVMFWRKATADRTGKIDPIRKIASPAFSERYAPYLKATAGQPRGFPADCAVGSVESLGVIARPDRDQALVSIKWSGKQFIAEPDGRVHPTNQDLWAASLFVLSRMNDVKTDLGKSISSAHCPNCGAPESGGDSNACEFCGTVLNDGRHGWVLEDVLNQNTPEAKSLLSELMSNRVADARSTVAAIPNLRGLLGWMIKVATADRVVDPREKAMLLEFAARWSVTPDQLDSMITAGLRGDLNVLDPHNNDEARSWIGAMAAEAWADGQLTREEIELIRGVATRAGLAEEEVNQLIADAKTKLYREAAAALKAKKDDASS